MSADKTNKYCFYSKLNNDYKPIVVALNIEYIVLITHIINLSLIHI